MSSLAKVGIYPKCWQCHAEIMYGEPPHRTESDINGKVTVQLWCQECIIDYSIAMWPEEAFGPCPHQQHKPGWA
jgi:hypothetical protein